MGILSGLERWRVERRKEYEIGWIDRKIRKLG